VDYSFFIKEGGFRHSPMSLSVFPFFSRCTDRFDFGRRVGILSFFPLSRAASVILASYGLFNLKGEVKFASGPKGQPFLVAFLLA